MARLVMKFGGTSVADIERIRNVARHVKREVDAGHEVAVVVSAMSGTTNRLVEWCRDAAVLHDAREYDTVVASGEQVTSGLLAIALQAIGVTARSWQGWQLPIVTSDAHALGPHPRHRRRGADQALQGAQGGRGDRRLPGPAPGDRPDHHARPRRLGYLGGRRRRRHPRRSLRHLYRRRRRLHHRPAGGGAKARRLDRIAFEEMLELASLGAKVLQVRSVELGMVHKVRIFVRSSFDRPEDIDPHGNPPGTLICDEEEIMEQQVVTGIAFSKDEAQISIRRVQDKPGVAASIFGPLADANINVDMIVQNVSADGATTDLTFTVPAADFERAKETIAGARATIGYERLDAATEVTKVSVIGVGMRSHAGVAAQAFKALAERGINIRAITTSEIKFSVLIDAAYTELAVRSLHSLYGLDKA